MMENNNGLFTEEEVAVLAAASLETEEVQEVSSAWAAAIPASAAAGKG